MLNNQNLQINQVEQKSVLNMLIFKLVLIYSFLILINKTNELLISENAYNISVKAFNIIDISFFILTTVLIITLLINLFKHLNIVLPKSRKYILMAMIIWSLKIISNMIIFILTYLYVIESSNIINNIFNFSLILNLSLLVVGLIIMTKNKLPEIKLWICLGSVQILNFIYNLIVKNISANYFLLKSDAIFNYIFLILKLLIVLMIINKYRKINL